MKIAIIDDQQSCADLLYRHVECYMKEKNVTFSVTVFKSGMEFLCGNCDFDVAFLDVQMPHLDGIETAHAIRNKNMDICIVFVTNYAQYAIKGYEVRAFDYLLKPVLYGNFCICMEKILRQRHSRECITIGIECEEGFVRLLATEIFFVESDLHYIIYHTKNGNYRKRGKLSQVAGTLEKYGFIRTSASYLVNLRYIEAVKDNEAVVAGETVAISRSKKKKFMEELTAYLGGTVL